MAFEVSADMEVAVATSQAVTFVAGGEKVWSAVVKLIHGAGYTIIETDQAAKQIIYQASGGGWAWAQNVQVSVTPAGESETLVTVLAEAAGQETVFEGTQQEKLIKFVFDELSKRFAVAENQPQVTNAPGTSGCLVIVLVGTMLSLGLACL